MSANIKASVDGTQAIIGVGGVDQMTVSNAGVVTANSFVGAASSATALATGSTTARTLANRFADVVNVKDFGAVGDGVADDTAAINSCISSSQKKKILFPSGTYRYSGGATLTQGTVIEGSGIYNTYIVATQPNQTLFNLPSGSGNEGSGISKISFTAEVNQTGGAYIALDSWAGFVEQCWFNKDFCGILMTGVGARIKNCRFQDAATGGIHIRAEGGDTSQYIDGVLMGSQTPANVALAGIRVRNSSALIISNTSVITMGVGLLIDPQSNIENVFSMYVNNCFFDHCTYGMKIAPLSTGGVYRCRFANCWFSSATQDGVYINSSSNFNIDGIHFESCHCLLNVGSGLTTGVGVRDLHVNGGEFCQNLYGIYINNDLENLVINSATIGSGAGLNGNTNGIVLENVNINNAVISSNVITDNTNKNIVDNSTSLNKIISNNMGYKTVNSGSDTILAGTTSVTVTHGLAAIPLQKDIMLVRGTGNSGSIDLTAQSINATTFVITTAPAPSTNMVVNWQARIKNA